MNRKSDENKISDFFDGHIYQKLKAKFSDSIILPFNLNVDGGKIFTSSKTSLWPLQLVQLYLPSNIRYLPDNMLVVGLYCGHEKPNLNAIIQPFTEEMSTLFNGLYLKFMDELVHLVPLILFCSCDLPARAEMQNRKNCGYNACSNCEHVGISVRNDNSKKSYVRYLKEEVPSKLRTHANCVALCHEIHKRKTAPETSGFKGIPSMILFKEFDLIDGFVTDWMHGSLLGIIKLLLDIWFGKRKLFYTNEERSVFVFKPMSTANKLHLNKRIMALKPYKRLNHKPRSIIDDRSFFSANEYRSLLWYHLKFALNGILPVQLVKHFELFSAATYMLSRSQIDREDIKDADKKLNQFADQFEIYYGKNSVTINVHMVRHYSNMVLNTGPLWTNSLFSFESNMGKVKRMRKATVDVVETIAFNYCLEKPMITVEKKTGIEILCAKPRRIASELHSVLVTQFSTAQTEDFIIGTEMRKNKTVYRSAMSAATKSIDSFVQMKSGSIGEIKCFVKHSNTAYILLKIYEIVKYHDHLEQVRPKSTNKYEVCLCEDIQEQLIYLKFNYSGVAVVELVTKEPNFFECN